MLNIRINIGSFKLYFPCIEKCHIIYISKIKKTKILVQYITASEVNLNYVKVYTEQLKIAQWMKLRVILLVRDNMYIYIYMHSDILPNTTSRISKYFSNFISSSKTLKNIR